MFRDKALVLPFNTGIDHRNLPCRPLASIDTVDRTKVCVELERVCPFTVKAGEFRFVFDRTQPWNVPADAKPDTVRAMLGTEPRDLIVATDNLKRRFVWLDTGLPDQHAGTLCPSKLMTSSKVENYPGAIPMDTAFPDGQIEQRWLTLADARNLHPGKPIEMQFPMTRCRHVKFRCEVLSDGRRLTVPVEWPEPAVLNRTWGSRLDMFKKAQSSWPAVVKNLEGLYYEDFDGDAPQEKRRDPADRMLAFARDPDAPPPRQRKAPEYTPFDGTVPGLEDKPHGVAFTEWGYYMHYYPNKKEAKAVVAEHLDSDKRPRAVYIFSGENCVKEAEAWVQRKIGFKEAREICFDWFPHLGQWLNRTHNRLQTALGLPVTVDA